MSEMYSSANIQPFDSFFGGSNNSESSIIIHPPQANRRQKKYNKISNHRKNAFPTASKKGTLNIKIKGEIETQNLIKNGFYLPFKGLKQVCRAYLTPKSFKAITTLLKKRNMETFPLIWIVLNRTQELSKIKQAFEREININNEKFSVEFQQKEQQKQKWCKKMIHCMDLLTYEEVLEEYWGDSIYERRQKNALKQLIRFDKNYHKFMSNLDRQP